MDGSTVDHSDSDSGESWTLLENQPAYGDDAPDFSENTPTPFEREHTEDHLEKDEDTDGISIISDSDPESAPCDITCDKCPSSENRPSESQDISCLLNDPQPPNKKTIESLCNEDDFLGDGSHKLKTYVHRRNKRLSMVLNIIMLGSVITAAGVAIGHMWGAKNECTVPTPSVNKILSNLYKLQEENAYLRNKLKELTLANNIHQMQHPKQSEENKPVKQQRCRKVFEEPLNNKVEKAFKCVDPDSNESVKMMDTSEQHPKQSEENKPVKQQRCRKVFEEPLNNKVEKAFKCVDPDSNESVKMMDTSELLHHEKEFLKDIGKLKKVYNQNKSWLDDHIQRRLNHENNRKNKHSIKEDSEDDKEKVYNQESKVLTFKLPNLEEQDESNHIPNIEFRIPESEKGKKSHKAWNLRRQTAANKVDPFPKNKEIEKPETKLRETKKSHRAINLERQLKPEGIEEIKSSESFEKIDLKQYDDILNEASQSKEKKISYADSVRTDSDSQKVHSQINDSNELPIRGMRGYGHNRKHGDVDLLSNLISSSEDDIKKDDRYTGPKMKRDKKKHDRHKIHKKQKRKNKYEQWEMKGGYMKDFDEFSMTSSKVNLGNEIIITPEKKYLNNDFQNYLAKLTKADQIQKTKKEDIKEKKGEKGKKGKNKDLEWYDKRYALRAEARRKLEHELFGETSPNNAAWYFRRMNKREQCRAQKDNSTFKKFSKQKMNFKMKH